jgi:hypothetical protein
LPAEAVSEYHKHEQKLRAHLGATAFEAYLLRAKEMTQNEMRAYAVNRGE